MYYAEQTNQPNAANPVLTMIRISRKRSYNSCNNCIHGPKNVKQSMEGTKKTQMKLPDMKTIVSERKYTQSMINGKLDFTGEMSYLEDIATGCVQN